MPPSWLPVSSATSSPGSALPGKPPATERLSRRHDDEPGFSRAPGTALIGAKSSKGSRNTGNWRNRLISTCWRCTHASKNAQRCRYRGSSDAVSRHCGRKLNLRLPHSTSGHLTPRARAPAHVEGKLLRHAAGRAAPTETDDHVPCDLAIKIWAERSRSRLRVSLYSDGEEPSVPAQPVERKLAAIFAADIAGYSRLMARDELGTLARLKACRAIIDDLIASHRGRIFNTAGDSVVADFASPVDAVQCAVAVQAAISTDTADGTAGEPMQFRIGVPCRRCNGRR